ncbi:hypothetical protein VKT23_019690 [Stygiomarasmius scandens]|uniref:F-box domain-containing protein n=1 Tax=Marasmiellus scandens TaxID=2682957 RepID=A0ABR1IPS3_9AGAR
MSERDDSTHSILIPEILGQIFEHLVLDRNDPALFLVNADPPRKRDLISCALSCKAFTPLALSLAWRQMDSVLPLLKLLPGLEFVDNQYVLTDLLTETDLVRFDSYAPLIKEYYHFLQRLDEDPFQDIIPRFSPSILSRITQLRPVLLPSLTTFTCDAYGFYERIEIDFFVSPSLKHVKIHAINHPLKTTEILMYFPLLASRALDVQKLELSVSLPASPSCFRTISCLTNLRCLSLSFEEDDVSFSSGSTVPRDIESLGILEYLEELRIHGLHTVETAYALRSPVTLDTFKSLKTLAIFGEYSLVKTVFDLCQHSPIHRLQFEPSPLDPRMVRTISHAVSQWTSTLEHLTACHQFDNPPQSEIVLEMSRNIEPLASLSNLKSLTITAALVNYAAYIVRDEDVIAIAETWPGLEELELTVMTKDFGSGPSVRVLKVLADKCRNLKRVAMPLNLDLPEVPANVSSPTQLSTHGLESFKISVISSVSGERLDKVRVDVLAYYIWSAFPRVRNVLRSSDYAFGELWDDVQEEVEKLQGR